MHHQQTKTCHITTVDISIANLLSDRLKLLKQHDFSIHTASSGHQHKNKIMAAGLPHSEINSLTRRWDVQSDIKSIYEIYKFLKNSQFEIVNTYSPKAGVFGRIAAKYARIPIVVHTSWGLFYSEDSPVLKKIFHLTLEFFAGRHCDHIFSVNRDDIDVMIKYRIKKAENITYLGNGTDLNCFHPQHKNQAEKIKHKFKIPQDNIVVGIVGRVVKEKGYQEFIDAAVQIKASNPNVEFVSVGPLDPDKPDSFGMHHIREIENRGVIRFLGYQTDMRSIYSMLDVIVLPSYREGHPRSLVEACAMGIPIITTNTRGCKETVENNYNGFLVPLKDTKNLIEKIDILVKDEHKRSMFSINSRQKAEKDYDQVKLVQKIAQVYNQLIQSKRINLG